MMKSCSMTNAVFLAWRMNLYAKEPTAGRGRRGKHHVSLTIQLLICIAKGKDHAPFDDLASDNTLFGVQETVVKDRFSDTPLICSISKNNRPGRLIKKIDGDRFAWKKGGTSASFNHWLFSMIGRLG